MRSTLPLRAYPAADAVAMGTIASRLVALARRWSRANHATSSGTMMIPPPTPNSPERIPAATPIAAARSHHGDRWAPPASVGEALRRFGVRQAVGARNGLGVRHRPAQP